MTDSTAVPSQEKPSPIDDRRMNWRRPIGLAMVGIAVFMVMLICVTVAVDVARTKARRTIMHQGRANSVWISSEPQGYFLKLRSGTGSASALIATESDLSGAPHDYVIEWDPDQNRVIGRIGSCRGTIILH